MPVIILSNSLNVYFIEFISTQVLRASQGLQAGQAQRELRDLEDRKDQQKSLGLSQVVRCTHAGEKRHALKQPEQLNYIQVKKFGRNFHVNIQLKMQARL